VEDSDVAAERRRVLAGDVPASTAILIRNLYKTFSDQGFLSLSLSLSLSNRRPNYR
jgi:hypothetical protein